MSPHLSAQQTPSNRLPASKVAFLCIGAQKGGTTWLNEQLLRHPGVCLPPVKEIHYFNYLHAKGDRTWIVDHYVRPARTYLRQMLDRPDEIDWQMVSYYAENITRLESGEIDEDWYHRVFRPCDDIRRLKGDITPAYLALPREGIEAVRNYNADIRLVALLRDPIDRAISAARMMLKRKQIRLPSDNDWRSVLKGHGVIERSRYSGQLRNWFEVFEQDQLLVLPYEQIATDAHTLMDQICDFIGINRLAPDQILTERVHTGRNYSVPGWVREHCEILAIERENTVAMLPQLAKWWGFDA